MKYVYKMLLLVGLSSPLYSQPLAQEQNDLPAFLHKMGTIEGLGSYKAVSSHGYLGLYQFHPKTIKSTGYKVSRREFLNSPALQDSVMVAYMRMNAEELHKLIKTKVGTYYRGIYITKAGILAGAHLVGTVGVLSYFYPHKFHYRTVDGNGVHVSKYIKMFSSYNLREI